MTYKETVRHLQEFVEKVSGKTGAKAVVDMARNITGALFESEIDVDAYQKAYREDKIFDPSCLLGDHENLFDFVSPEYQEFCEIMLQLRPVGLGTPNAMVGEGEFLAVFCSPRAELSKKSNRGDIIVDGKTIELKGASIRIMGDVTGVAVQRHAQKISAKYEVEPNSCSRNRTAFEPWDKNGAKQKVQHWLQQFERLGVERSCAYLNELCGAFMRCEEADFSPCFDAGGKFDAFCLQRVILKKLFCAMEKEWDAFTVLDGKQIKCLPNDGKIFAEMVDSGRVIITGNYFRSFQNAKIGLYIGVC